MLTPSVNSAATKILVFNPVPIALCLIPQAAHLALIVALEPVLAVFVCVQMDLEDLLAIGPSIVLENPFLHHKPQKRWIDAVFVVAMEPHALAVMALHLERNTIVVEFAEEMGLLALILALQQTVQVALQVEAALGVLEKANVILAFIPIVLLVYKHNARPSLPRRLPRFLLARVSLQLL